MQLDSEGRITRLKPLAEDFKPLLEALMAYLNVFHSLAIEYGIDPEKAQKHSQLCYSTIVQIKEKLDWWDERLTDGVMP